MAEVVQWIASYETKLDCGHIVSLTTQPHAGQSVGICQECRTAEIKANDDALRNVTMELRRRGIPAEYYHSGGGCMVVRCEIAEELEWVFGLADVCWGGDFSDKDGHVFSVESPYPTHTRIETVADWIWAFLSLPPFVDPKSGQHIIEPYWDETRRFPVDPWDYYGLPFPAGSMTRHVQGVMACDNCAEPFIPAMPNALCTRCQQPDPANAN